MDEISTFCIYSKMFKTADVHWLTNNFHLVIFLSLRCKSSDDTSKYSKKHVQSWQTLEQRSIAALLMIGNVRIALDSFQAIHLGIILGSKGHICPCTPGAQSFDHERCCTVSRGDA